ncbi:MAG: hypothetical protein ACI31C_01235 [Muribaculaceae bacterium]
MDSIKDLLEQLLKYFDSGNVFFKPFKWLYWIISVLVPIFCIAGITETLDKFKYLNGAGIFFGILIILVILAIAFFGFLYWFRRADDVEASVDTKARFVALPPVSHFIRTLGEFAGIVGASAGTLIALFTNLEMTIEGYGRGEMWVAVIAIPIFSYVVIVLTRFLSEMINATTSIANDVHSLADFNPPLN